MTTPQKCLSGTGKDRSSFAITCNRLSLLMKEKGTTSLRDIGINATFDVKGKREISSPATETNMNMNTNTNTTLTTVDLLGNEKSAVQEKSEKSVINHLPRFVSLDSFCKQDDSPDRCVSGEMVTTTGSKTSQMTILYNGQILVFDYISPDKAREMMFIASGSSSDDDDDDNQIQNRNSLASRISGIGVNESELPIVRRSSLHKFLATRKERAAPYQLHNRVMANAYSNRDFDLNF